MAPASPLVIVPALLPKARPLNPLGGFAPARGRVPGRVAEGVPRDALAKGRTPARLPPRLGRPREGPAPHEQPRLGLGRPVRQDQPGGDALARPACSHRREADPRGYEAQG